MRATRLLVDRPDFTVRAVACRDDHARWSPPEPVPEFGVVLVRSGGFRRRGRGGEVLADRTMGYATSPGDEEHFAHPYGGDECTSIRLGADLWQGTAGPIYVDARLDLAHRLLWRAAHGDDPDFAVAERLVQLLDSAPDRAADGGDRTAVERAREAIRAGHPEARGLVPLARLVGVSPYRLSRAFHAVVGAPLTRYRNRVRVGAALDRLEQGETSLAALAFDLGFADQAHLTRTVRAHLGHTPRELQRLLAGVRV
ncbi:helix-turn-helix transcriptional regulator [Phytohabitans houttuyneae]|uniref:helix-turn-helix domain-containing protein n=1 Tax=Phytohabitans houttuyneae TaxID=1076126 RepID=UPI0031EF01E2